MAINLVDQADNAVNIEHVLVSVSDKAGLDAFLPELAGGNPRLTIYSTGGTYQALKEMLGESAASRHLVQVSAYTGQPEMQGGLVKTLDFKIYLGLLSETYNAAHVADLARTKAVAIDMVVVNLYPFKQAIARAGVTPEMARTNIDIGGPCMVRASAKNFLRVAPVTDPADYPRILAELGKSGGRLSLKTRFDLATKAFTHTAEYDAAISRYLAARTVEEVSECYKVQRG